LRHPFWILNSSLLLLALITLGYVFFSQQELPERQSIAPRVQAKPVKMEVSKINISKIYENDLFGTYSKEFTQPTVPGFVPPVPEPPSAYPVQIPEESKPTFLEPLPITLKGIIFVWNDDTKNRAIIADNRTTAESSYKVGDVIEDAQLIRIFNNKIIFMRSNGQQEVLYLREKDAKLDPSFANIDGWENVIQMVTADNYQINTLEFTNRISSLGQLIDMLDITTVYKQGESIGSRIGVNNALSAALGMQKGDVITLINDIPATTTNNRMTIFKKVITLSTNDAIHINFIRNGREEKITYTLQEIKKSHKKEIGQPPQPTTQEITKEQLEQLQKSNTFAPTLKELRQREKSNMLEKGKRPSQNVLSNLNE
jgi:type II secretory pathway component PulC